MRVSNEEVILQLRAENTKLNADNLVLKAQNKLLKGVVDAIVHNLKSLISETENITKGI